MGSCNKNNSCYTHMIMNRQANNTGFTLIELLMVIAIAAILMTVAVPGFQGMIQKNRLATISNEFITALNYARSEAVTRGIRVTVGKTGANWENGWEVFSDRDGDGIFEDDGDSTLCEDGVDDCVLRSYPVLSGSYTLRANNNFTNFVNFKSNGQSNNMGSFVVCDNSDGNNLPEANTSRLIVVNRVGRTFIGLDADNDGIPEKDDGSEITSCTTP